MHDAVVAILNQRGFACSGVLIHPRAVLTARHCKSAQLIVFGADVSERRKLVRVAGFRGAPNAAIDLGIMILAESAPVAAYPLREEPDAPRDVRVVGFGCLTPTDCETRGKRTYFDARMQLRAWGCEDFNATAIGCLPSSEMALPRTAGADTCIGDSGGAVLEATPEGWRVVAITSRSVADAVLPCGDGGIYIRVQPQLAWIRTELKNLQ